MLHHVLEDIGTLSSSSSSTLQAIILLRREHQDGGWMDDLLRGRVRYYFKSVSPPPSEVRRTSCRRLFQRMGNLEAGIAAHLRKALVKNQSLKLNVLCICLNKSDNLPSLRLSSLFVIPRYNKSSLYRYTCSLDLQ